MKYFLFLLFLLFFVFTGCNHRRKAARTIATCTRDRKFILSDDAQFVSPGFKDSWWRSLKLPHDKSIDGEFSRDNPAVPGGGINE